MLRLCSTSCVRQNILSSFGIPFVVSENGFDEEQLCLESHKSFAYAAALGKHQSALKHLKKFFYANVSQTHFEFGEFNAEAMESYLQSNAWRNKAGAFLKGIV